NIYHHSLTVSQRSTTNAERPPPTKYGQHRLLTRPTNEGVSAIRGRRKFTVRRSMETLENVSYAFTVNVAGPNPNRMGQTFVNLEFKTKDPKGCVKYHTICIPIAEFAQFMQHLNELIDTS
uniref:Uncharacterized protein n=1 Tax=Parascaris univalens TaxID=6257 RepID=A0A915C1M6_PARUN